MLVAIASENNGVDGRLIGELVRMLRGIAIEAWPSWHHRLPGGWGGVVDSTTTFLKLATGDGVQRAVLMIDNDGGAKRRPEHLPSHDQIQEAKNREDGCATCLLSAQVPAEWLSLPNRACVVVPVQTLETWLLVAAGSAFKNPVPERNFHRRVLKRDLYGATEGDDAKLTLALATLQNPNALTRLRQRPSFAAFEQQIQAW